MPANEIPMGNESEGSKQPFLLGQPIWWADAPPKERWTMAVREEEPTDEASKGDHAFRPAPIDDLDEDSGLKPALQAQWRRKSREELIQFGTSVEPEWQRMGVVCGAGLGKTTNLKWLEAEVNRLDHGRGKHLAIFLELRDLREIVSQKNGVRNHVVTKIPSTIGNEKAVEFAAERIMLDGRVTWLLDSLDQADPDPKGPDVAALRALVTQWSKCRVWVSGRPYAFRIARVAMELMDQVHPWQFIRIGQLDEPECRQLLETTRRPGAR